MAGTGLLALLDDIATIADDVATLTVAATKKTSGIVTDDLAVTAEQTIGLRRDREIPVVLAVAWGSLKNKALILAPGALILNAVLPVAIVPILMLGGAYLSYEGVEKLLHRTSGHADADHDGKVEPVDPVAYERERVSGAIRTDLVLSAEIIALTLGMVAAETFGTQVAVLYSVSLLLTVAVYGLVAALVRLDDLGEAIVRRGRAVALGQFIIRGTPWLLHGISWVGTIAMLMVGGHILWEHVPPVQEVVHRWLETLPHGAVGVVGVIVDIAAGAIVGLALVAVMAVITALRRGPARR